MRKKPMCKIQRIISLLSSQGSCVPLILKSSFTTMTRSSGIQTWRLFHTLSPSVHHKKQGRKNAANPPRPRAQARNYIRGLPKRPPLIQWRKDTRARAARHRQRLPDGETETSTHCRHLSVFGLGVCVTLSHLITASTPPSQPAIHHLASNNNQQSTHPHSTYYILNADLNDG